MILDQKLDAGEVIVLDGATGTEIARHGAPLDGASWAGVFNKSHPDIVRQVHEDYIRAGADIITANTFATHRHVLDGAGLGDESVAITRRGIELALEARDRVAPERPVAVAGSMSTMLAWAPGTVSPEPRHVPAPEQESANFREMRTRWPRGCRLHHHGNDARPRKRDTGYRRRGSHRSAGLDWYQLYATP